MEKDKILVDDPGKGGESDNEESDSETETGGNGTPPTSDDNNEDEEDESEEEEDEEESDGSDWGGVKWGPCWLVPDFFAMLKNQFTRLNYIPYSHRYVIDIWINETQSGLRIPKGLSQSLQSVYGKHGWPDLKRYKK